jgi:hypothetical protein
MSKSKHRKPIKGKDKSRRRRLPWYLWVAIIGGIVAAVVLSNRNYDSYEDPGSSNELKAAIIDQLYLNPNQGFIDQVTQDLKGYGFEVDLYQGKEVTVDLYRQLPAEGYKLILFRAHSGRLALEGEEMGMTFLFTAEPYSWNEHYFEQLGDRLVIADMPYGDYPDVFAINSRFIEKSIDRSFPDTVIIVMGCSGTYLTDLAEAFIEKGASVYIGWSATVRLDHVDKATINLIENLSGGMTVKEAVTKTMAEVGPDPESKAVLKYHQYEAGNRTITELIK